MKRLLLGLSLLLTGCVCQPLTVFTDYVNREDLASFYVETPDPALNCPDVGQRLVIFWSLPWEFKYQDDVSLEYTIRLHDHTEIVDRFLLTRKSGCVSYFVKNKDFFQSGGIATFKVAIYDSEEILYEWIHPLWVDLLQIGEND